MHRKHIIANCAKRNHKLAGAIFTLNSCSFLFPRGQWRIFTFWDESGFLADGMQGKALGIKGPVPAAKAPGRRQTISAATAVSTKGAFWFATYKGTLTGELLLELLKKLMKNRKKPLHLILDGRLPHKTLVVKNYVASTDGKLILYFSSHARPN